MDTPHRNIGILLTAAGALGFSTIILFTRSISGIGAFSIAFFRALSSFVFFSALSLHYREIWHLKQYRPVVQYVIGLGISMSATGMLYIYAVQHTTAANAVLLNNTSVIYIALLAPWLLHEARPKHTWLSVGLALAGVTCIANPAKLALQREQLTGIGAGVLSGITLATTMLLSRKVREYVSGITQIWWSAAIATLMTWPWGASTPWPAILPNLPYLIALGVFAQGIPYLLYFLGLRYANAQVVSLVALLEPVGGILIGISIYHEIPDTTGIIGIILILTSILLVAR